MKGSQAGKWIEADSGFGQKGALSGSDGWIQNRGWEARVIRVILLTKGFNWTTNWSSKLGKMKKRGNNSEQ